MRYIAANAELLKSIRGRGTHLLGRIRWLSTGSEARFLASPSANPAGIKERGLIRLRAHALLKVIAVSVAASAAFAPTAVAQNGGMVPAVGGTPAPTAIPLTPLTPGPTAKVIKTAGPMKGLASPPAAAPPQVQNAIWAANQIIGKPYKYGGGHKSFRSISSGYDCSSTVSWALNGAGARFLDTPLDSGRFMKWGEAGPGAWFTVYTNPSHAFLVVAGLRLDTSAAEDPGGRKGPRWRPKLRKTKGFKARHPLGF